MKVEVHIHEDEVHCVLRHVLSAKNTIPSSRICLTPPSDSFAVSSPRHPDMYLVIENGMQEVMMFTVIKKSTYAGFYDVLSEGTLKRVGKTLSIRIHRGSISMRNFVTALYISGVSDFWLDHST